jgi:hypothetical protein
MSTSAKRKGFHTYSKRLDSFKDWKGVDIPKEKFAEAGLFFKPEKRYPDLVCCYSCGIGLYGWEPYHDPLLRHQCQKKGRCEHLMTSTKKQMKRKVVSPYSESDTDTEEEEEGDKIHISQGPPCVLQRYPPTYETHGSHCSNPDCKSGLIRTYKAPRRDGAGGLISHRQAKATDYWGHQMELQHCEDPQCYRTICKICVDVTRRWRCSFHRRSNNPKEEVAAAILMQMATAPPRYPAVAMATSTELRLPLTLAPYIRPEHARDYQQLSSSDQDLFKKYPLLTAAALVDFKLSVVQTVKWLQKWMATTTSAEKRVISTTQLTGGGSI